MINRLGKKPDPYTKSPGQIERDKKASEQLLKPEKKKTVTYGGSYGSGRIGRKPSWF